MGKVIKTSHRGRPRKSAEDRREATLRIRLTREEKERIEYAAGYADETLSEWCRGRLLD